MSKPLIGVILGAVLGVIDGLTAWFTPAVRDQLGGIVIGSTFKGIIAGIAIGFFAKKFHSLPLGILFGHLVGAFLVVHSDHCAPPELTGSGWINPTPRFAKSAKS